MKNSVRILTWVIAVAGWMMLAGSAHAVSKSGIEVVPAFADITIAASESSKQIEIYYANHGKESVSLEMYPLDFRQRGELGQITFFEKFSDSYSYSLSSFLSLESNRLELAPGERKKFIVTVLNRQDLSPGGHYAGVIGRVIADGSDLKTAVSPSISSLLLLKKTGGERYHLSLIDRDWPDGAVSFKDPREIELVFENSGNVHLTPYGVIEVRDFFGRLLRRGVINTASSIVFPESRRRIKNTMTGLDWSLPVSVNTVTIKGQDSLKKTTFTSVDTYVYINPIFAASVALLAILGVMLAYKKRVGK